MIPIMEKSSALFPVTFFNGETEINMGTIQITPSLTYKSFQSIISQTLQISPHQITIYFQQFQNPNHYNHHNHRRRRQTVTRKFDFGSIICDDGLNSNGFFWVVQKRPRRTRRRRRNHHHHHNNGIVGFNNPGENFIILKRGELIDEFDYFQVNECFERLSFLEREKERYLMSMSLNSHVYDDLSFCGFFNGGGDGGYNGNFMNDGASSSGGGDGGGYNGNFSNDGASSSCSGGGYNGNLSDDGGGCGSSGGGSSGASSGFCDVCFSGDTVPFHWCKNDAVTKVFRSPAGPIARPKKIDFLG